MQEELQQLQENPVAESTILDQAKTDFTKERREADTVLNQLKNPEADKVRQAQASMNYFRKIGEPEMDWFNFETRVRKVIYEVVEPLTKKQFQTFDGFDMIKKQIDQINGRYEETLMRVDRVIKRNEANDRLDKYCREIEAELLTTKALQRNDVQQILEKLETWAARWKVTQNDVNNMHKFDDKLSMLQKSMIEMTDSYKDSVTERLKQISLDFLKQLNHLEVAQREQSLQFQDTTSKVNSVKEFTKGIELKFQHITSLMEEMREGIENSRFTYTYGTQQNDNKVQEKIAQLQSELHELRKNNLEIHSVMQPPPPQITPEQIQKLVAKCQIEMLEKVLCSRSQPGFKRVSDYQDHTQNLYLNWRAHQVDHHSLADELADLLKEPASPLPKGVRERRLTNSDQINLNRSQTRKMSISQHNKVNSSSFLRRSTVQPGRIPYRQEDGGEQPITVVDQTKERAASQLQNINENTNEMQEMELLRQQAQSQATHVLPLDKSQDITARVSLEGLSNHLHLQSSPPIQPHPLIKDSDSHNQDLQDDQESEQNEDDESQFEDHQTFREDTYETTLQRLKEASLWLTQEQGQALLDQQLKAMDSSIISRIDLKLNEQLQLIRKETEDKYNHKELHQSINGLMTTQAILQKQFSAIKSNENAMTQLQQLVQRSDVTVNFIKNDLQQQIYKLKEFDEGLYIKQIETNEKLDMEMIKLKRDRSDLQLAIDKLSKELGSLKSEDRRLNDVTDNLGECLSTLVEIQTISIALLQQDEIDKKIQPYYDSDQYQQQQSPPVSSLVPLISQTFQRNHLIHTVRVLLESQWQTSLTKDPFSKVYPQAYTDFTEKLVVKVAQICTEFQQKIDLITAELEKQGRGLPREIVKIKEGLEMQRRGSMRKMSQKKAGVEVAKGVGGSNREVGDQKQRVENVMPMQESEGSLADSMSTQQLQQLRSRNIVALTNQSTGNNNHNSSHSPVASKLLGDLSHPDFLQMPEIQITKKAHQLMMQSAFAESQNSPFHQGKASVSSDMIEQFQSQFKGNNLGGRQQQYQSLHKQQQQRNMNMSNIDIPKQKMPIKGSALAYKYPSNHQFYRSISKLQKIPYNQKTGLNDTSIIQEEFGSDQLVLAPIRHGQHQQTQKLVDLSMDGNSYGSLHRKNQQYQPRMLKK